MIGQARDLFSSIASKNIVNIQTNIVSAEHRQSAHKEMRVQSGLDGKRDESNWGGIQ